MRKSKTQEKFNRSTQSDSKCRMTREQMKQYKISQLKIKFKRAIRQIRQMKQQNQEDQTHLSQLMLKSQRIEKRTRESQEKTKLMLADSLNLKARISVPPIIQPKQNSFRHIKKEPLDRSISVEINNRPQHFILDDQTGPKKGKATLLSVINSEKDDQTLEAEQKKQKINIKSYKNVEEQSQLKRQSEQNKTQNRNEKLESLKTKIPTDRMYSSSKASIKIISESTQTVQRNNRLRKKQTIAPYICALLISILILLLQNQ